MQTDLQRLAALIDGWSQTDQIPDVERDLALQKLRDLYEAIRFAGPEAVLPKEASADAVPEVPEEELPESLDLGAVLSLDGFPDLGEPEGPIYAEPAAPFGAEVGPEPAEPEPVEPAESQAAEPQPTELTESSASTPTESVEEQPAEPAETQSAEPAESQTAEPQPAELTELAASTPVDSVEPQPAEPAESVASTPAESVEEQPAESAETQPAEPETAETAESQTAKPQSVELTESAESASVESVEPQPAEPQTTEPEIPESVTLEPDAPEASVTLDSSRSTEPAAAKSHHAASPTLFGMEDEETVRHRHKQRVIMSLYGPSPEPERPAASGRRPSPTPGAFSPASSTSTDASQPFEIIEVERGSEALTEKATSKQTDEGPTAVEPHSAPVPADQPAEEVSEKTAASAPVESVPTEPALESTARTASASAEPEPEFESESEPELEPEPESESALESESVPTAPTPAPEPESKPRTSAFDPASDDTDRRTEGGMPIASAGAVLGEVINPHVQTLADTIAPPRDMASEILHNEPITDLRQAIGLNDKFLLIRDLFGGDGAAFERAIETLNGFDDLDDCMIFIAEHYAWNPNSDGAKLLMELLERKFA